MAITASAKIIPKLIKDWEDGFVVVNTIRDRTAGIGVFKMKTSDLFYIIFNFISKLGVSVGEADFRLIDKEILQRVRLMPKGMKFYRGLFHSMDPRTSFVHFSAGERIRGKSSYSLRKMLSLAVLGIASFKKEVLWETLCFLAALFIVLVSFIFFNLGSHIGRVIWLIMAILVLFLGIAFLDSFLFISRQIASGRTSYRIKESIGIKQMERR
jgi:dolichol-phosphate mannosyltransferase